MNRYLYLWAYHPENQSNALHAYQRGRVPICDPESITARLRRLLEARI